MVEGHKNYSVAPVCVYVPVCDFVLPESFLAHNFVLRSGISKLFGTKNYHGKMMCLVKEPCCQLESPGHTGHMNFMHIL